MSKFSENYKKWEEESLKEFKESEYWEDEFEKGTLDITEDGDVYLGNMVWYKGVVTSWKESKYYTE